MLPNVVVASESIDLKEEYFSCQKKSELENTGIVSIKLAETSTAWNGSELPDYPIGKPVISIFKYIFPPHTVTNQQTDYSRHRMCGRNSRSFRQQLP